MQCLQHFCSVLSDMEEQLSEDQAAVYGALSDPDRCSVWTVELQLVRRSDLCDIRTRVSPSRC